MRRRVPTRARRAHLQVSFATDHVAEKLVGRVVGVWVPGGGIGATFGLRSNGSWNDLAEQ